MPPRQGFNAAPLPWRAVRLLLLLLLLVLAGFPALGWAEWARLDAPGGKLNFDAYSVDEPLERGWLVTRGGAYDVAYAAALTRTHDWMLTAAAIPLDAPLTDGRALLARVQAQFLADSDPLRFRITQTRGSVETLRGATCARTFYRAEDRLAAGGELAYYVIEAMLVTCIHPKAPQLAVEVGYHERYLPGEKPAGVAGFGERFIRSIKFWWPVREPAATPLASAGAALTPP